jgi:ferric-dicitrate binding protein FerR (iron transport regulator)
MNNESHNDINYELLARYFAGNASPAEALELEAWLSAAPPNRQLLEQLHFVWCQLSQEEACVLPNSTAFFNLVINRFKQQTAAPVRSFKKVALYTAIAASLLVAVSIVLFNLLNHQPASPLAQVTRAAQQQVVHDTLPDRSVVILNSYARISHPPAFAAAEREVQLDGEAWFNVTPNKAQPFVITTGPVRIKVVGTSFNVRNSASQIEVAVKTGVVRMLYNTDSITIQAGQKGVYHTTEHRLYLSNTYDINELAYATRIFNFENATLKNIAAQLEKAYGITVVIENEKLAACTLSSTFENKPLDYIFDVLSMTLNIQYRIVNKTVYISGNSCS